MSYLDNSTYSNSNNPYSIDNAVKPAVNVSDATQLENNFVSLMVAQIQNQDPTSPLDSSEFLNQYSSMSQVKSLENMVTVSKNNLVLMDNIQTLAASSLVGKEVSVNIDNLNLGNETVGAKFTLLHNSTATKVTLTDRLGQSTDIDLGNQPLGTVSFNIDPSTLGLAPGNYKIAVTTASGEYPSIEVKGQVSNVRVTTDGPQLEISGIGNVPFYNITEFGQIALNDLY